MFRFRPIAVTQRLSHYYPVKSLSIASCLLVVLCSCAPVARTSATACETSVEKVAERPVYYIGKRFCGEVVFKAGRDFGIAQPVAKPPIPSATLELVVLGIARYLGPDTIDGMSYRVYLEGLIDGQSGCFTSSDDVCVPFNRGLFLSPTRFDILGPA